MCRYAVKKITFKRAQMKLGEKVLREVTTLAPLEHPNIVRYGAAQLYKAPRLCRLCCTLYSN